jgi:hypothetical protein
VDDHTRQQYPEDKYQALKRFPKDRSVEDWLQQWETTYTECKRIQLPEAERNRSVRSSIKAVKPIAPGFSEFYMNYRKTNSADMPDLYGIIQKFREYHREQGADDKRSFSGPALPHSKARMPQEKTKTLGGTPQERNTKTQPKSACVEDCTNMTSADT